MNSSDNKHYIRGFICIFGGICIHLFLGCLFLYGNIQVYITSYFHIYDPSINLNKTVIIATIMGVLQGLTVIFGPFVMKRVHPKLILLVAGSIGVGGIFGSTFMTNFTYFAMLFSLFGLSMGFCYLPPLLCAWEYFPERKGLITGIVLGAFGFGAFVFGFISFALANPNNHTPQIEVPGGKIFGPETAEAQGAMRMLRINCAIWFGLILTSVICVTKKPKQSETIKTEEETTERPESPQENIPILNASDTIMTSSDGNNLSNIKSGSTSLCIKDPNVKSVNTPNIPFKAALKDYRTYLVCGSIFFSLIQSSFVNVNFKNYGLKKIPDDQFITLVGTLGSVFNGLSRSGWGYLVDKFQFRFVFGAILVVQMAIGFSFQFIVEVKALYLIWVIITYACLGGHFAMPPSVFARMYGPITGGKIHGVLYICLVPTSFITLLLTSVVADAIGYGWVFFISAGFSFIALCIIVFLNERK
ncbi:unnamed protein product [Moneuplotes crassus]|uniref:Major facilitator superfamily (MFS) profile domain-containing protein n=1 Tax=Euplotes crassus TaxID=5936 RepID=A0AAD1XA49_EUPCR|nr:unnamed protein product [Moneuplotes crassus]